MSLELKAQKGDTVSVHYIGKFPGGKIFDTSMEKEAKSAGLYNAARDYHPLMVILGTGKVIQGFDEALMGMKVNEEKEIVITREGLREERDSSYGGQDAPVQAPSHQHTK